MDCTVGMAHALGTTQAELGAWSAEVKVEDTAPGLPL